MKLARVISGAVVALLGTTAAAHAVSLAIAIGTAIAGAIGIGAIGAQIITALVGVLFSVGVSLLARALQKKPGSAAATGDEAPIGVSGQIMVGGDNPLSFIVGRYATAGSLEYVNTWGDDGKTPNAYLTQVISLGDLPVDSLAGIFVNGQACTLISGQDTSAGTPIAQFRIAGKDHLWIKFYDGTQVAADPYLLAKFSTATGRPWTADMIGRGVNYAIATARINRNLFTGVPTIKFVIKGIPLYDPRKDTTVGGSGPHRWSTPSTWEWSENPVVISYNIMRGVYYNGKWVYGMQNLPAARLPVSSWMAAASACDVLIPLATGGSERQYRAGAEIRCSVEPMDMVEELLKACSARLADVGGLYKIHAGAPGSAVYAFTDDEVVITDPRTLKPFFGLENTYNAIHAKYPEPLEAWEDKDAPPRYSAPLEAKDDDRRLIADVVFPVVPYKVQVQRLMREIIQNERRFRKHVITLGPSAYRLEPNDVVEWTSVRNGYDTKLFFVMAIDGAPTYNQTVTILEVDPNDYDWNSDFELPDSVGFLGPVAPEPQGITDWFAEGITVITTTGKRWPGLRLSWDGDQDDVRAVKWQVREKINPSNVVIRNGYTEQVDEGEVDITANLQANTQYQARGIYVGFSGRTFLWSDWIDCTTPNTPFNDLSVELDTLGNDARNYLIGLYGEVQNIRADFETFAANVGSANIDDIVQKNIFQKRAGVMSARIVEERLIRTGETGALAQQTTALESRMDDTDGTIAAQAIAVEQLTTTVETLDGFTTSLATQVNSVEAKTDYGTAFGLFGMKAISGPAGVEVRLQMVAQTEIAGAQYNGGLFLDLFTNGTSQLLLDVDRLIVLAGSTKFKPLVFQGGILKLDNIQVNGADIADASIATAKIGNAAITSAKIGNAQIQSANIGNLTVDTIHIKNGAIARTAATSGAANTNGVVGATVIACSATIANPSAAGIMFDFAVSWQVAVAGSQPNGNPHLIAANVGVQRNGILLGSALFTPAAAGGINPQPSNHSDSKFVLDLPGAGTHVYRVIIQITSSTAAPVLNTARIVTSSLRFSWTSK